MAERVDSAGNSEEEETDPRAKEEVGSKMVAVSLALRYMTRSRIL